MSIINYNKPTVSYLWQQNAFTTKKMVARGLSLNMEVNLMVHVMSLHQLMQTMVARELFLNMETMVARELSLNMEARIFTEPRRGDKRRKRPRNYATLRMCTVPHVRSVTRAVVYLITLTG